MGKDRKSEEQKTKEEEAILESLNLDNIDKDYLLEIFINASQDGHEKIFNKILKHEKAALVNAVYFGAALQCAAKNGRTKIVNTILNHERMAQVDDQSIKRAAQSNHLIPLVQITVFKHLKKNKFLNSTEEVSKKVFDEIKEEIKGYVDKNEKLQKNIQDLEQAKTYVLIGDLVPTEKAMRISPLLPLPRDIQNLIVKYANIGNLDDLINNEISSRKQSNPRSESKHSSISKMPKEGLDISGVSNGLSTYSKSKSKEEEDPGSLVTDPEAKGGNKSKDQRRGE